MLNKTFCSSLGGTSAAKAEDYKNYKEDDFNTSFTYHLDEDGLQTAFIGIDDLKNCLPLTLVFLPALKSVEIQHENTVYYSVSDKEIPLEIDGLSLRVCSIQKCTIESDNSFEFISLKGLDGEIAIPVSQKENKIFIGELSQDKVPKIFCDFPLVGSEKFGIPFFVNSSYFYPTEPRDGVFLTDKKTTKINLNKQILKTLTTYYIHLIDFAAIEKWENLYQLANIYMPLETYWLSTQWYKENILKPIQDKVYITALVRKQNGSYVSLKNEDNSIIVDIPFDKSKEIRHAIWDLVADVKFFILPAKTHIDEWYKIFKGHL